MTIELHQRVTLNKVAIRKKGPSDARILMIDIKLAAVCDPDILSHFDPTLKHFLFIDGGGPRMRNLKPIAWDGEVGHMDLTLAGERFIGAALGKFKFEALPSGRVAMSCVASVHPESRQTAILADLAGEEVEITLQPEPQLDLRQPDPAPEKAKAKDKTPAKPGGAIHRATHRAVQYRHPRINMLTWSGYGRQPVWVAHFINDGGSLDELRITNQEAH